ncbi:hypothetical protein JCM8547_001022 [Rhodosporidiobolus lusitaniae]
MLFLALVLLAVIIDLSYAAPTPVTTLADPVSALLVDPLALPFFANNSSSTPKFDSIVAFGDQWTDDGSGAFHLTDGEWPSDRHYYSHSFTNGPTYISHLSSLLRLPTPTTSFGTDGATTNTSLVQGFTGKDRKQPARSVNEQVSYFVKSTPFKGGQERLFVLQGGLNDWLYSQGGVSAEDSARSLGNAALQLSGWGVRHILLLNLPSPLTYPYAVSSNPFAQPFLSNFTRSFRDALWTFDAQYENVVVADVFSLFQSIEDHPTQWGYEESVGEACLTGVYGECGGNVSVCTFPSEYVWWDQFNPTNTTHTYLSMLLWATLKRADWI